MKLWDLMDMRMYKKMLDMKYVRINTHPHLPLQILNYTESAQFDQAWNEVTLQCRGLIIDDGFNVVARPFDKFFNYGDSSAPKLSMDMAVQVTDKLDGSLGILWNYKGAQGIATRGSFTSDQAVHATSIWFEKYNFPVSDCWTYLFEIIYPENRIVLNYGDMDDLILLGVRDNEDGQILLPQEVPTWKGPVATSYSFKTLSEALAAPPRANAEGYVVYVPELDDRVKIKQEDYVALHKIVTGLTERRIWENMKDGKTLQDLLEIVPDEWHDWLRKTYYTIKDNFTAIKQYTWIEYSELVERVGTSDRKKFAAEAFTMNRPSLMFMLLDGKDIFPAIWAEIRPSAE